MTTNQLFKIL